MDDEQLGKSIVARINEDRKGHRDGNLYLFPETMGLLGRAARELLAKPVATREGVAEWIGRLQHNRGIPHLTADDIFAALSRFAPPRQRMMIEGMAASEINAKMREGDPNETFWHCARVAHRLATTPAPEVDADARAKALAYEYHKRANANVRSSADLYWNDLNNASQDGWRAVAAMEKGNG